MHTKTQEQPGNGREQSHCTKLDQIDFLNARLGLTEHAVKCAVVESLHGKASGRQGHGHSAEQGTKEGDQVQESGGLVQGRTHLGSPVLKGLEPYPSHAGVTKLGIEPGLVLRQTVSRAGQPQSPSDA